jgi:protein tyrosine phosphatase
LIFKDSPYIPNQRENNQLGILMEFFERIVRSNPIGMDMNSSPIIVHCSAGIGRSGATIAIDMILNKIRSEGFDIEIDIPNIVKHIRSQRSGNRNDCFFLNLFFFVKVLFKLKDNMN